MSADDGYLVAELDSGEGFGIFHYFSSDEVEMAKTIETAIHGVGFHYVFTDATRAVLMAHVLQQRNPTEYGVHVTKEVLQETGIFNG